MTEQQLKQFTISTVEQYAVRLNLRLHKAVYSPHKLNYANIVNTYPFLSLYVWDYQYLGYTFHDSINNFRRNLEYYETKFACSAILLNITEELLPIEQFIQQNFVPTPLELL